MCGIYPMRLHAITAHFQATLRDLFKVKPDVLSADQSRDSAVVRLTDDPSFSPKQIEDVSF